MTDAIINSPTTLNISKNNQCDNLGKEGWLADDKTCNRYYRCQLQNGVLERTVMDVSTVCQSSAYIKNCTNPETICKNRVEGYYAAPNNCNKYYYCKHDVSWVYSCATSGPGWAREFFCGTNQSSIIDSVSTLTPCSSDLEEWMSDSASCSFYFKCYLDGDSKKQTTTFNITDMCASSPYVTSCSKKSAGATATASGELIVQVQV